MACTEDCDQIVRVSNSKEGGWEETGQSSCHSSFYFIIYTYVFLFSLIHITAVRANGGVCGFAVYFRKSIFQSHSKYNLFLGRRHFKITYPQLNSLNKTCKQTLAE